MTLAIAYLGFDGNCADAMRHYERVLGGRLEALLTGADTPMKDQMPPQYLGRVMHARLALPGGGVIYGGDAPADLPYEGIKGVSITLDYPTAAEGQRIFDALADGGRVTMPYGPVFWAERCGMLTDRYGVAWIVNGAQHPL